MFASICNSMQIMQNYAKLFKFFRIYQRVYKKNGRSITSMPKYATQVCQSMQTYEIVIKSM